MLRKVGPSLRTWSHFPCSEALRRRAARLLTFLFVLCLLRPHSLSLACNLCYSSCAVCPTRSWKDRKTDLENYFMHVISDYRTAAPACALYWQTSCPGVQGQGQARIMPSHGSIQCAPLLTQGLLLLLLLPCEELSESTQSCQHSSCGETGEEAPPGSLRWPESFTTFNFFLLSRPVRAHSKQMTDSAAYKQSASEKHRNPTKNWLF